MNVFDLKLLGDQYEESGDYESAELLYRKALSQQEVSLGEDHPSLAVDLYNLGLLCFAMEKFSDAESLLMRAWSIERHHYGATHPCTQATLEALSDVYYDADRNVEMEYTGLALSNRTGFSPAKPVYH